MQKLQVLYSSACSGALSPLPPFAIDWTRIRTITVNTILTGSAMHQFLTNPVNLVILSENPNSLI